MYDVIILGAGSAGLTAASIFRKTGAKYLLVHHGFKGTTCADRGCMPSKTFIQVAKSFAERRKFEDFGILGGENLDIDLAKALEHVRGLRDYFTSGIIDGLEKYNFLEGQPRFISQDTIEVEGKEYKAKNFIIATGSSPRIPQEFKKYENDILTTDNFFEQKTFPKRMAVIGLGAIGVELGQALGKLGVNVTGINRGADIAGLKDDELSKLAKDILSKDMNLILNEDVQAVTKNGTVYTLTLKNTSIECDQILMAAGRVPNITGLGLEDIGIQLNEKGMPHFDKKTLKIKDAPIYLSGDVNGLKALLHEAHDESTIIAAQILDKKMPARRVALAITFTEPNIAQIGAQPNDIAEEYVTGSVSYDDQGRARVMGENHGMLKIYTSKKDHYILGASMIAPAGEHMAHLIALAIHNKMSVKDFLDFPFYHPVVEEGLRTALRQIHDPERDCVTDRLC